jgi:hypothetical protein
MWRSKSSGQAGVVHEAAPQAPITVVRTLRVFVVAAGALIDSAIIEVGRGAHPQGACLVEHPHVCDPRPVAAGGQAHVGGRSIRGPVLGRDDVDDAHERVGAIYGGSGSVDHLDLPDVRQRAANERRLPAVEVEVIEHQAIHEDQKRLSDGVAVTAPVDLEIRITVRSDHIHPREIIENLRQLGVSALDNVGSGDDQHRRRCVRQSFTDLGGRDYLHLHELLQAQICERPGLAFALCPHGPRPEARAGDCADTRAPREPQDGPRAVLPRVAHDATST